MARSDSGTSPIEISKHLKGVDFPASKEDLVQRAQQNDASQDVIDTLKELPDQEYGNMADVMKGVGQTH